MDWTHYHSMKELEESQLNIIKSGFNGVKMSITLFITVILRQRI